MEPVPISRSALQQLKAKTEEENRQKAVKRAGNLLYTQVLSKARSSSETCCKFELKRTVPGVAFNGATFHEVYNPHALDPTDMNFILDNQSDVIKELRTLFPDSTVNIKTLSKAADGNFYDISTLDESLLKFVDRRYDQTCLVVDWS